MKNYDYEVLEAAQMSFESGQRFNESDFDNDNQWSDYLELIELGPAGFYEEFKDELDFDPDFIREFGDDEDDYAAEARFEGFGEYD